VTASDESPRGSYLDNDGEYSRIDGTHGPRSAWRSDLLRSPRSRELLERRKSLANPVQAVHGNLTYVFPKSIDVGEKVARLLIVGVNPVIVEYFWTTR